MTAEQRRHTISRWARAGLNWRSWTVREMTAVLYEQLVSDLYQAGHMNELRTFLRLAGDKSTLAALDREIMGQTASVQAGSPRLRGQPNG